MGLTNSSTGIGAVDSGLEIKKQSPDDWVVALAGNPNVGKSTVFNGLTGMNQHTGNWPGKTVSNAQGYCCTETHSYVMVDIPGTYSLMAHSAEEEVARNFICFGKPDAVVVVCDATCLERNLNLVLQTMEITSNVIVCVNLLDEARRKRIKIDLPLLSKRLGVPVVGTTARKKKCLKELTDALDRLADRTNDLETPDRPGTPDHSVMPEYRHSSAVPDRTSPLHIRYSDVIEEAIAIVMPVVEEKFGTKAVSNYSLMQYREQARDMQGYKFGTKDLNSRWLCLKLLNPDDSLIRELNACLGADFLQDSDLNFAVKQAKEWLEENGLGPEELTDRIVSSLITKAEEVCRGVVASEKQTYHAIDRKIDRVLTSKRTGYPVMLLLLAIIFWITVSGANYPSQVLSEALFWVQDRLTALFHLLGAPEWLHGALVLGVYRVLAWVVSVMLPPMAIFFPLFTLLEDAGYLPRIAYNLDKPFKCCRACGKQALTMCMGFGCNAAGIVGCRIIDSPRERLLAILTNNFVPCNGRFPTLIAIITMFFIGTAGGAFSSVLSAVLLTAVILSGILITFGVTKLLSATILKGVPSSFTLELPPYRKPQIGRVIVRSVFDRTLFVLGRAVSVAAPAGLIIWLAANITIGDTSILRHCADFLDPLGQLMGMDGVILIAFILGFPANEIVMPIMIMAYMAQGSLAEMGNLMEMRALFAANGWTWVTAVCVMLFSVMHWPCSTALLTIKKETGSLKWTVLAATLPTVLGIICCMAFAGIMALAGKAGVF